MRKIYIYALAAALLALAGCKREVAPGVSGEITINASIGAMTKVSYDGNTTSFTAGDQIAVYAWIGDATSVPANRVVNGEVNTFDGTAWTPANQMEWYDLKSAHYFLGITPVAAVTDFKADPYTLDPADYTGSDLMIATSLDGITPSANPVDLTFTHAMAKLNVNLKFRSEFRGTPTVTGITVKAKNTATVNYLTKAVTATGDASEVDIPAAATAATGYALSYSGLQVPQDGVTTVTVTIDGKTYVYESSTDIPLVGGQYTTLGLILGNDKIEFDGISVADWDEEITFPAAEAVLINKHNGHEYVDMGEVEINGVKKHLYWATCNIGADNPWDYGDYYAWGETATKTNYSWGTYSLGDGATFSKYTGSDYTTLQSDDDAASKLWGGSWRIPTDEEWQALLGADYEWVWTTDYLGSGKDGMLVTRNDDGSGTDPCAGNSIFLPAAGYWYVNTLRNESSYGYYWSSSYLYSSSSDYAWYVGNYSGGALRLYDFRCCGYSLRPVFCERYPLAAADVASEDIGRVLAADGNIYADAAQASAAGTEARAVIAYVGSVPNYFDKFLAIAMEDVDDNNYEWADAHTAVGTFAGSHAINIGGTNYNSDAIGGAFYDQVADDVNATSATRTTGVVKGWRLPSVTDWRFIFDGLGRQKAGLTITAKYGNTIYSSNATPNDPLGVSGQMYYYKDGDAYDASSLRVAINAACGNTALKSDPYWSSSESSDDSKKAWDYDFYFGNFTRYTKWNEFSVRPVFAY